MAAHTQVVGYTLRPRKYQLDVVLAPPRVRRERRAKHGDNRPHHLSNIHPPTHNTQTHKHFPSRGGGGGGASGWSLNQVRGESFSVSSMRMTLAAWVYILKLWDKQGPTLSQCCSTHSPRSQRMWWVQGLPRPAQAEPDSPPLAREARGQAANHPAREARGQAANHPAQEAG